jgi:hypothetical protein
MAFATDTAEVEGCSNPRVFGYNLPSLASYTTAAVAMGTPCLEASSMVES